LGEKGLGKIGVLWSAVIKENILVFLEYSMIYVQLLLL
jgi:hypothetical protein